MTDAIPNLLVKSSKTKQPFVHLVITEKMKVLPDIPVGLSST